LRLRHLIATFVAAALLAALTSAPAFADAFGPQLQITNQGPAGNVDFTANLPALAYNTRANEYLMVYEGTTSVTNDIGDIYGLRLDGAGSPIGAPFPITTTSQSNNEFNPPGVAYNPDLDQYLVAWSRDDDESVRARRVSATGVPIAPGDGIITTGQDDVESTEVAYSPQSREYLVVWKGNNDNVGRVRGQRLTADAREVGPTDFELGGSATLRTDDAVSIAYNATSQEYFVVFRARIGATGGEYEIFGQRLALDGSQVGPDDFRISDMGPDGNTNFVAQPPRVAWDSRLNEYLVVWTGSDTVQSKLQVFGQFLRADGSQTGGNDFQISHMGPEGDANFDAGGARVAYDPNADRFLVAWHGDTNTPPLIDDKFEIFGQDITGDGPHVGTNFRISNMPAEGDETSDAFRPALTYNPRSCDFLATWFRGSDASSGGGGTSTGESEIFDRRVAEPACAPGVAARDTTRPVISALRIAPDTIAAAAVAASKRLARRTKVRYRLSEAGTVRFTVQRRTIGRRVGKRCRKATARNRKARRCVRYVKVGRSFTQKGKRGRNSKTFSRKTIHKRSLRPGRYRLRAVATDAAGNRSRTRRASFRVK
jgi:hypothetical protein